MKLPSRLVALINGSTQSTVTAHRQVDVTRQRMADLFDAVRWLDVTTVQPFALKEFLLARVEEIRAECGESDPVTDGLEALIRRRIEALSCSEAELEVKMPLPVNA